MRENRRQSQIVNNFFSLATIVMITIVLTLYVKYGPKPKHIHSDLPCQKLTYTYDKTFDDKKLLEEGFKLLNSGSYLLDGGFIKPRFGKSYLKDEIDIDESNEFFELAILKEAVEKNYFLKIKYELIENDKNDPRKTQKEKKHAGTLISSFRINQNEIFRMYTEFKEYDKSEIKNRINCTIKAFRYNAKQ
jgi:hypothetical protein